jgi:hypothetical protein
MALSVKFTRAKIQGLALARLGNPLRNGILQTSKELCHFEASEAELLTHCFLKPFRVLEEHRFHHETSLDQNRVYNCAKAIFSEQGTLLENAAKIAQRLFEKSDHPNIKPGDLCISVVDGIVVNGKLTSALCIVKCENTVPFLQISVADGDLHLMTHQGIYPDKIDKGCLIFNDQADEGYSVLVFDKGGADPLFWNRQFLSIVPKTNDDFLTKRYSELCMEFAKRGLPESTPQESRYQLANRAVNYLVDAEEFDRESFESKALQEPKVIDQFKEFKDGYEEDNGFKLEEKFVVSKDIATKAKKKLKGTLKLDTGAEIRFKSDFIDDAESLFEQGFDEARKMRYVKILFNEEC